MGKLLQDELNRIANEEARKEYLAGLQMKKNEQDRERQLEANLEAKEAAREKQFQKDLQNEREASKKDDRDSISMQNYSPM